MKEVKVFAIIEAGGKQYLVKEGDTLKVEKLPYDEGSEVVFDKVLLLKKENEEVVGAPYVEGAKVLGKVLKQMKERKIKVFTYHAKTTHKRMLGHRQRKTVVKIEKIELGG